MHSPTLFAQATQAVEIARQHVKRGRISHVAFRSKTQEEWQTFLTTLTPHGTIHLTFKPDGRHIPFIQLHAPLTIEDDVLEYLEFPAPKLVAEEEPQIVIAFQTSIPADLIFEDGYEIRQQLMHTEDLIARGAHRAA